MLGRDVSHLSDDQLRNLVSELERRFRDEGLTSAAQAATIILEGVKANRWRILVGVDAHRIDEMVRQSPARAYDIAFFDEFAREAGWTERLSLEPRFAPAELITGPSPSAARGHACCRCGDLQRGWFDQRTDRGWNGERLSLFRYLPAEESPAAQKTGNAILRVVR